MRRATGSHSRPYLVQTLEGFLFRHVRWSWRADRTCERRQPRVLRCRVAVYDVVSSWRALQSGCRCRGGIIDVHPAPHPPAIVDNRNTLLAGLLAHIAIAAVPGARAVEEAVA